MEKEPKKPGAAEKTANFFERLHYAIGATAIGGFIAETVSKVALVRPELLAFVGAIEVGHGLVINGLKNFVKNFGKGRKAAPAPA